ncbi:molybdopterin-guanine dinucleotide biosynthesis protein B [Aquamicrobium zhengzhouense]|uniref:Molybdopterin-guanine dinucleotide biosynthesis protein B n=1 Tax=Aquamicrobium zhengzhouense TaxID=2781738 RepID=A0ABS0S7B7_9HYPH|nr:molybdopterin-guanine dinucleotide biosynthesis protein B [Aquamicrobium zhengzhouense]MBI1619188.1 molybdopterin-guanine dinucleotide biosynthesis protein B [Aquamicrobium zhengzhouense]
MQHHVIGISGWKNSGKTTLTERLVSELTSRGRRVSTIKHAHHETDVDQVGTDSFRHRAAGAGEVLLATSRRWALMHEIRDGVEPTLEELLSRLSPCDIVLVEGFKRDRHPKIEVRRLEARDRAPLPGSSNIIAIAADHAVEDATVPAFDLNDIAAIADFIETTIGLAAND